MEDRLRLRPTAGQYQAFADHLCEAHSWYKHLPLLGGRRFVVFVAADAGLGQLVAMPNGPTPETTTCYTLVTPPWGPEFTDEHPRIHHTWQTTREYRGRFGHLDYMCRYGPEGPYVRDAGPPVRLPDEVEERCGFVLYPYVSEMFADAVTWDVHAESLRRLRDGAPHPARQEVLELAANVEARRAARDALSDAEWQYLAARRAGHEQAIQREPSEALCEVR